MEEKNNDRVTLPEAADRIDAAEADRVIALISLDVAKFEVEKIRVRGLLLQTEAAIAECNRSIADLRRRVANVDYPPAPEKETEKAAPSMGKPVGPSEGK